MEGYYYFDFTDHYLKEEFSGFLKQFPRLSSIEVPITLLLGLSPEAAEDVRSLLLDTLQELCLHWDCSELVSNPRCSQDQPLDIPRHLLDDWKSCAGRHCDEYGL